MSTFQKIILMGYLGKDPDTKYFEGGGSITNFSVATTETYKNKQGERVSDTTWHNVVSNGKQGETIAEFFKKGMRIYIEGKLRVRSWDDNEGKKHYITEVRVDSFGFVDSKSNSGDGSASPTPQGMSEEEQDDLPF